MNIDKVVITGANGFLGRALTRYYLEQGVKVVALARRPDGCLPDAEIFLWDGETLGDWVQALDGADALINLAGRTVNCRYSEENKNQIIESRVQTTQLLGEAIKSLPHPPKVWLNSSTATIYEHRENKDGNVPHTEALGVIGEDFSMGVAKAWEEAFFHSGADCRKVAARIAIVLGAEQGTVFQVLSKIVKLGLGGKMGSGAQQFSWIHEEDFCRAVDYCLRVEDLDGAINLVSPQAESNADLMRLLRKVWKVPIGLPAYKWMLKIGTFIMRSETELVLKSRWVHPERLLQSGFTFKHPTLKEALEDLRKAV